MTVLNGMLFPEEEVDEEVVTAGATDDEVGDGDGVEEAS